MELYSTGVGRGEKERKRTEEETKIGCCLDEGKVASAAV